MLKKFHYAKQQVGETVAQYRANLTRYAEIAGIDLSILKTKKNTIIICGWIRCCITKQIQPDQTAKEIMTYLKKYNLTNIPMKESGGLT